MDDSGASSNKAQEIGCKWGVESRGRVLPVIRVLLYLMSVLGSNRLLSRLTSLIGCSRNVMRFSKMQCWGLLPERGALSSFLPC